MNKFSKFAMKAVAAGLSLSLVSSPSVTTAQTLSVVIYYVDISGFTVDPQYYACGNTAVAGPFASSGSAIDWRDQFIHADGRVFSHLSSDPNVCNDQKLMYDSSKGWYRY